MAGKKNPWGGGAGSGGGSGDGSGGGDKGGDGPRNPWLPGGDKDRRSANIEDIFKNRGPEGPRRSGGGGGSNFKLPERGGGKSWWPVIAFVVLGVWILSSSFHVIGAKERGVVTTMGKYWSTMEPGFNISAPYPLQSVDVEPVSTIRIYSIPEGNAEKLILTGDQNLVNVSYLIRWNIKDLKDYKFQLASPEDTIREVAEAAMRAAMAEKTLDETFSGQGRAEIEEDVRGSMQALLDAYRSGVAIQGVQIDKAEPPAEVNEAFKDVSVAEQDANAAVNRARGFARQRIERAEGEAGAFDRVYEEYRQAPEVTKRRLYYETMERVLSQTDKTIVEGDGVTPYLPLPEIKKRAAKPAEPAAGGQ
ncbi:MAG: protease modulator HflK [Marinomonas sp.]